MRLLHVTHSADPAGGGVIEAIYQLAEIHQREGHAVEILSLDAPTNTWTKQSPVALHARGTGKGGYGYAPVMRQWLARRRASYDLVIVHGLWQYHGRAVRLVLHGSGIPYVVFPHGMLDPWFRRTYPLKHVKKWLYWRFAERETLRAASRVYFTSEEEQRLAYKSFRGLRCNAEVINLGVSAPTDICKVSREGFFSEFPELRGKRLILFLGRLHKKKGCGLLIKAFAKVWAGAPKPRGSESSLHLVIAGPCADAGYLNALRELVHRRFPGEDVPVTWTGMLKGDSKWGAYRAADVFVLPSHQENFGMSVVEALACGVPVLISDQVNIWREVVESGAGLADSDSETGVVKLLQKWLTMPLAAQRSMRIAAGSCFRKHFEVESAAEKLASSLQRVCQI